MNAAGPVLDIGRSGCASRLLARPHARSPLTRFLARGIALSRCPLLLLFPPSRPLDTRWHTHIRTHIRTHTRTHTQTGLCLLGQSSSCVGGSSSCVRGAPRMRVLVLQDASPLTGSTGFCNWIRCFVSGWPSGCWLNCPWKTRRRTTTRDKLRKMPTSHKQLPATACTHNIFSVNCTTFSRPNSRVHAIHPICCDIFWPSSLGHFHVTFAFVLIEQSNALFPLPPTGKVSSVKLTQAVSLTCTQTLSLHVVRHTQVRE